MILCSNSGEIEVVIMEDWVTIRNLKKRNDKLGTREIAQILNISRNTVRSALRRNDVPVYKRKEKVNPDVKPFQDYIHKAITIRGLRKSKVLEDIRSKGYKGSKSAFYRHCDKIKKTESRTLSRTRQPQPSKHSLTGVHIPLLST
jgi:hypothetical protein